MDTSLLLQWHFDPGVLLVLVALTAAYVAGIGPLRRRYHLGEPATRRQMWLFAGCIALLFITLVSPLDVIANDYLFSAHITQVVILTTFAPPLLLLSLPTGLLNPLLRRGPLRQMTRGMSFLFLATFLFNANFALWLIPALYNPAVQQMPLHDLQSLIFLCTGVLNWWPLITPASEGPRWPHSIQLLYLFLDGIPLGFVCVILFFINQPAYAAYTSAPHLWGISALADFQLGAIILYAPGLLLDIVVLSIIFFKWLARQEEVARQREEAEDAAAAAEEAELAQSQQAAQQA
ncbi:MAG TPA: cytochrome c oxidase assembly protein [Ktedonobacterales bacterium]|nr:cytochrome c oxidase assembly protein [Ktedonobacterales bacterium]